MSVERVEICGGIASGKTTLARLLKARGLSVELEDFHANPFWRAFYRNPKTVAFETELVFLLQHYHQIKQSRATRTVCDFSLILDRAYVDVTLGRRQREAFLTLFEYIWRELGPPQLLIYLTCDPREELRRIRRRGRAAETAIDLEYLRQVNQAVGRHVRRVEGTAKTLRINSQDKDFCSNRRMRNETAALIFGLLD